MKDSGSEKASEKIADRIVAIEFAIIKTLCKKLTPKFD